MNSRKNGISKDPESPPSPRLSTSAPEVEGPFGTRRAIRKLLILVGLSSIPLAAGLLYAGWRDQTAQTGAPEPTFPGENHLDRLDRLAAAEGSGDDPPPFILPGTDVDGCVLLTREQALRSPLCCPGTSPSPADCPNPVQGMGLSVLGGKVVIIDADTPVPAVTPGSDSLKAK